MASCHRVAHSFGRSDGEELFGYFLRPARGFESHHNILDYLHDRNIGTEGSYPEACRLFEQVKLEQIRPYDGVRETLDILSGSGYRICIVTDAHSRDAALRLEKIGLLPYFSGLVSFDMTGQKKPSHEPFLLALDMMKAGPGEAVLIGDSPRRDIEPGHALGMRTIYARYGDRFSDDRSDVPADFTIDCMNELPKILEGLR